MPNKVNIYANHTSSTLVQVQDWPYRPTKYTPWQDVLSQRADQPDKPLGRKIVLLVPTINQPAESKQRLKFIMLKRTGGKMKKQVTLPKNLATISKILKSSRYFWNVRYLEDDCATRGFRDREEIFFWSSMKPSLRLSGATPFSVQKRQKWTDFPQ